MAIKNNHSLNICYLPTLVLNILYVFTPLLSKQRNELATNYYDPIFQIRKLRGRKVEKLAQGQNTVKRQIKDFGSDRLDPLSTYMLSYSEMIKSLKL